MLNSEQIKNIENNQKVVFATSSKDGQPRCVFVIPSRVMEKQIILSNIQMNKSMQNIMENSKCFINVYMEDKEDLQYKIEGVANVYDNGELFKEIKRFEETENLPPELKVNSIIVVNITSFEESNG